MAHRSLRKSTGRPTFQAALKALTTSTLAVGAVLSLSPAARAVDHFWIGTSTVNDGTTADYSNAANWNPATVPAAADNADVFNGGTVYITNNGASNDLNAGGTQGTATGDGTFIQTAGTFAAGSSGGWMRLGFSNAANGTTPTAATGTVNLQGGTMNFGVAGGGQRINIGEIAGDTGNLIISGGTFNNVNTAGANTIIFGGVAGATGNLTISAGTLNNLGPIGNTVAIGNGGTSTFAMSGGALNSNGEIWIGNASGTTTTANISGGTINAHNWLAVGRNNATATVNMTGGVINKDSAANGSNVTIGGIGTAQTPYWNQTGGSLNIATGGGQLWIGETASATLSISGGTINANNGIALGQAGGAGTLLLQGASSGTTGSSNLANGGGTEVVTTTTLFLGSSTTTSTATFGGATVNLEGGTLNLNTFAVGGGTGGGRAINFLGTTVRALADAPNFLGGPTVTTTIYGTDRLGNPGGGLPLDTNGHNVTITAVLQGDGSGADNLIKLGAGALILNPLTTDTPGVATNNTYAGSTTVNAGVLDAQTQGAVPNLNTAGKVTINAGGAFAVGVGYANGFASVDSITGIRNGGTVTFAAGSSIGLDIAPNTSSTYATNLSSTAAANSVQTTDFYKLGGGTLTLTGTNTYTGSTYLQGGLLAGNIGTGRLVFNGGGFQYAANNPIDYSARGVVFNGVASIDTNGNNVTFASPITGTGGGSFTKLGLGNLTLSGGFNFTPTTNNITNLFVQQGAVTLTGTSEVVNSGGNYLSVGLAPGNFGTLNVANGASFTTTGDFNVADVGGVTGTTLANNGGVINISGAGTVVNGATVFIGKGGTGTAATVSAGTNSNGSLAVGVVNQSGGVFTGNGNFQVGSYGQGQINLTGGTLVHTPGTYVSIGRFTGGFGVVDVNGGTFNDNNATTRTIVGEVGTGVLNVRNGGILNVASATNNSGGTLTSAAAALTIGNAAGGVGIVNLLPGGTINTLSVGSVGATTASSSFNFNGGVLKNTAASPTFIQNLTTANVQAGGAFVDTTGGNATIAQALVAPAGQGVSAITGTTAGTFVTTPIVQITGGGGTGATALANLDANGNISSYTITSPGINYTSAPTVTVTGASGTVVTATGTLANNVSGGLTKQGANILTLTGVSTYTGPTVVSAGTLALSATGSINNTSLISTATGTTFSVAAPTTFSATQTLTGLGTVTGTANSLTINGLLAPGATAALGSVGTLAVTTTGTLTLAGTVQFDISDPVNKDLINAAGAQLTLGGTLALNLGTNLAAGTYTLFSGLASETGNFATVTGTNGRTTTFAYDAGSGNYNLTLGAVPEPSTWVLGVFGLGGMAAVWMRRRRVA